MSRTLVQPAHTLVQPVISSPRLYLARGRRLIHQRVLKGGTRKQQLFPDSTFRTRQGAGKADFEEYL